MKAVVVFNKVEVETDPVTRIASSSTNQVNGVLYGIIRIPTSYEVNKLTLTLAYEVQNIINDSKYKSINAKVGSLTKEQFVDEYFLAEAEAQIAYMDVAIELGLEVESGQKEAIEQYKILKATEGFNIETYKKTVAAQLEKDNPVVAKNYEELYDKIKPKDEKKNESDSTTTDK